MKSEGSTIIGNAQTDYSTGGYTCSCGTWVTHSQTHICYQTGGYLCSCGAWVSHSGTHSCGGYALQPYIYPMTYTTIDGNRLAELMEAERKLKEIRRILGDAFG